MNQKTDRSPLSLFLVFLKIGAFTFGGGYAMIPLIQKETVDRKHWIEAHDILDIVAIAESTPGPIAINSATFVGYKVCGFAGSKVCGFAGSFAATFGVVLPSFLIILAISYVLRQFEALVVVQYAFNGIRAGVLVLILRALFSMYHQCQKNLFAYVLMAASFIAVAFLKVNVLLVIACCAAAGIISALMTERQMQ